MFPLLCFAVPVFNFSPFSTLVPTFPTLFSHASLSLPLPPSLSLPLSLSLSLSHLSLSTPPRPVVSLSSGLYAASRFVDSDEHSIMLNIAYPAPHRRHDLYYLTLVQHADRADFEADLSSEAGRPATVTVLRGNGTELVAAPVAARYLSLSQDIGPTELLGLDFLTLPAFDVLDDVAETDPAGQLATYFSSPLCRSDGTLTDLRDLVAAGASCSETTSSALSVVLHAAGTLRGIVGSFVEVDTSQATSVAESEASRNLYVLASDVGTCAGPALDPLLVFVTRPDLTVTRDTVVMASLAATARAELPAVTTTVCSGNRNLQLEVLRTEALRHELSDDNAWVEALLLGLALTLLLIMAVAIGACMHVTQVRRSHERAVSVKRQQTMLVRAQQQELASAEAAHMRIVGLVSVAVWQGGCAFVFVCLSVGLWVCACACVFVLCFTISCPTLSGVPRASQSTPRYYDVV